MNSKMMLLPLLCLVGYGCKKSFASVSKELPTCTDKLLEDQVPCVGRIEFVPPQEKTTVHEVQVIINDELELQCAISLSEDSGNCGHRDRRTGRVIIMRWSTNKLTNWLNPTTPQKP